MAAAACRRAFNAARSLEQDSNGSAPAASIAPPYKARETDNALHIRVDIPEGLSEEAVKVTVVKNSLIMKAGENAGSNEEETFAGYFDSKLDLDENAVKNKEVEVEVKVTIVKNTQIMKDGKKAGSSDEEVVPGCFYGKLDLDENAFNLKEVKAEVKDRMLKVKVKKVEVARDDDGN